jgi:hypothetical protein
MRNLVDEDVAVHVAALGLHRQEVLDPAFLDALVDILHICERPFHPLVRVLHIRTRVAAPGRRRRRRVARPARRDPRLVAGRRVVLAKQRPCLFLDGPPVAADACLEDGVVYIVLYGISKSSIPGAISTKYNIPGAISPPSTTYLVLLVLQVQHTWCSPDTSITSNETM